LKNSDDILSADKYEHFTSAEQSTVFYFWNSSGILLEFFWNSPRILLDFFWTSSGILLEFFWITN